MIKLEGITELRGKTVVLEDIENSKLRNILHSRLRGNKFNFFYRDTSYSEYHESKEPYDDTYKDTHTDRHRDNYTDRHRDNHTDRSDGYYDIGGSHPDYQESSRYGDHTDKGHTETTEYGYDEHTDGYHD